MAYIRMQYKSKVLVRGVTVDIFLPEDGLLGVERKPPFKTLYFLPGYSADNTEIFTLLGIRKQVELKGIAVVIPCGDNFFYINRSEINMNYSSFIEELVSVTRTLLPLSDKREDTFIGGISMGGYGALYNGKLYENIFSKIVAMSPAVDCYKLLAESDCPDFSERTFTALFESKEKYYENDTNLIGLYKNTQCTQEICIGCGRQDTLVIEAIREFIEEMKKAGITVDYFEMEGSHDLDTWENMLDRIFSFLADIEVESNNKLKNAKK